MGVARRGGAVSRRVVTQLARGLENLLPTCLFPGPCFAPAHSRGTRRLGSKHAPMLPGLGRSDGRRRDPGPGSIHLLR